jgi:hypothetical protein
MPLKLDSQSESMTTSMLLFYEILLNVKNEGNGFPNPLHSHFAAKSLSNITVKFGQREF